MSNWLRRTGTAGTTTPLLYEPRWKDLTVPDYTTTEFDNLYASIGRRILAARLAMNLTQADLSRSIGLTRSSVANIERGRQHPPLHVLLLIATELKLSLSDLLSIDNGTNGTNGTNGALVVRLLAESSQSRQRAYIRGWDDCVSAMRRAVRGVAESRGTDVED